MKISALGAIDKLYFGYEDLAKILGISLSSARVTASRYVRQGLLIRLKRNIYILREKWARAGREEKFIIANLGQVPSYISLMTALDYYEITTQMQRDRIESAAMKRTKEISTGGTTFSYVKFRGELYFGFKKEQGFFMATPEKALLDAVYLQSFGRYALDLSSIDAAKLDKRELKRLSRIFPLKTLKIIKKHGYL